MNVVFEQEPISRVCTTLAGGGGIFQGTFSNGKISWFNLVFFLINGQN